MSSGTTSASSSRMRFCLRPSLILILRLFFAPFLDLGFGLASFFGRRGLFFGGGDWGAFFFGGGGAFFGGGGAFFFGGGGAFFGGGGGAFFFGGGGAFLPLGGGGEGVEEVSSPYLTPHANNESL
ncbi:MAG: hypothetical protein CM1200mP21_06230 [Candidatus Poseidoniales archaeon]|nr:MAG: hypothetical protein CM1200mP21_06230 [Candidatus Poseidoniales archaeon]